MLRGPTGPVGSLSLRPRWVHPATCCQRRVPVIQMPFHIEGPCRPLFLWALLEKGCVCVCGHPGGPLSLTVTGFVVTRTSAIS